LWYHGLAVVGFDQDEGFPLYRSGYADDVRRAKEELGVYPTPLDEMSEELLEDLEQDPILQNFHFLPLYFPASDREGMMQALTAVANRKVNESGAVGPESRSGARWAAGTFEEGSQRRVLRELVEVLEQEWDLFYGEYWQREVAVGQAENEILEQRFNRELSPGIEDFLGDEGLQSGYVVVSRVLGPEGRLIQGNAFRGIADAVAVWAPGWEDVNGSLYSIVRELCFSIVDGSVINRATVRRGDPQIISGRAAVRCGSLLIGRGVRNLLDDYQRAFLRAAGADTSESELAVAFEEEFQVPGRVLEAIRAHLWPEEVAAQQRDTGPGWLVQTGPHIDLWFHGLAVVSADQPGPLGLYSADYASRIREIKRDKGVYPTKLDSLAPRLREDIARQRALDVIHFVPMYFDPQTSAEGMLDALDALAKRRIEETDLIQPDAATGVFRIAGAFTSGGSRRVLETLVEALENEWEVFYADYWDELNEVEAGRYDAVQSVWDSLFVPALGPYLERRKLTGGAVFLSPALGPEGRIVDLSEGDPRDQQVVVQMPLSSSEPAPSVFAFLKELCFILVDPRSLGASPENQEEFEDLRRRVAVRCGHLVLQFYAPTLASTYRRVFLDAVGAEESYTLEAFKRVYYVDPDVFERLRVQIRRR
jgi:hypothetical protein